MGILKTFRKIFKRGDEDEGDISPEPFPSDIGRRPKREEDLGFPSVRDFEQREFQGEPLPTRQPAPMGEGFPRREAFPPRQPAPRVGEEIEALRQIMSKLDIIESRLKIIETKLEGRRY